MRDPAAWLTRRVIGPRRSNDDERSNDRNRGTEQLL
jgi:hypothetical protein